METITFKSKEKYFYNMFWVPCKRLSTKSWYSYTRAKGYEGLHYSLNSQDDDLRRWDEPLTLEVTYSLYNARWTDEVKLLKDGTLEVKRSR